MYAVRNRASAGLLTIACLVAAVAPAGESKAADPAAEEPAVPTAEQALAVQSLAQDIAAELHAACPTAAAGDQAAFERCKHSLFDGSLTRRVMAPHILWGRQAAAPDTALKNTTLTQLAPEIHTGLYLPLFMFDGSAEVQWVASERLYRVRLGAAFRNRLAPGQFPYPFWHDAAKWNAYENANAVLFWIGARTQTIRIAQFTWSGEPRLQAEHVEPPRFDGRWLWTDAEGHTQPAATLFDGLYSDTNPYKPKIEASYRKLATAMRESQCLECHVPSNPNGLKRLVLLQTPAHAAGEIERILKAVRNDRMPLDETGIESPLEPAQKQVLLELGTAFASDLRHASEWETSRAQSPPRDR